MVYNGYYKVMSNIPKMGQLPTPVAGQWKTMESWLGVPRLVRKSPHVTTCNGNFWCYDLSKKMNLMFTPLIFAVSPISINIPHLWTTHITNRVFPKRYEPFEMVNVTIIWDSAPLTRRSQHCLWQHHDGKVAPLGLRDQI